MCSMSFIAWKHTGARGAIIHLARNKWDCAPALLFQLLSPLHTYAPLVTKTSQQQLYSLYVGQISAQRSLRLGGGSKGKVGP